MKKTKFLIGACLAFVLAGCSDDDVVKTEVTLPVSGDEVMFGASSGKLNVPQSRTIYGEPGDYENYSELEIKWQSGQDQVRVYSPQASSECKSADYTVQEDASASTPTYYLQKNGEIGVRWGDTNTDHNFYAFYPLTVDDGTGGTASIGGLQNNTTVSATIPVAQERGNISTQINGGTTWKIVAPNMTYCMMAGTGIWHAGNDRNVSLSFKPIVLVLDVVITANDVRPYNVLGVSVRSKTQPIVGSFTYDIASDAFDYTSPSSDDNTLAYVDCQENGDALELKPGEKLNVKFFLLPCDIKAGELTVSVLLENGQTLRQPLVPGGEATDGADLIHGEIIKVRTPKITPAQTSNWMSMIGNDVLFASQLSLPGTKYSYTYTQYGNERGSYNSDNQIMQTYQTLDIGQQFDAGVRAFDIKVNTGGTRTHRNPNHTPYIYVNGEDLQEGNQYQSLGDMLTLLKAKLDAAPTEFVLVSINWVDNGRTADEWVSDIEAAVATWSTSNPRSDDNSKDGSTLNDGDTDYFRDVVSTTTVGVMRHGIGVLVHAPESYMGVSAPHLNIIPNYSSSVQNTMLVENTIENNRGNGVVHIQNLQQMNNTELNLYPYYITEDNELEGASIDLIQTKKSLITQLFEMSTRNNVQTGTDRTNNLYLNDLGGFCVVHDENSTGWADAETAECQVIFIWVWNSSNYYLTDYRTKNNYTYFQDVTNNVNWSRPDASSDHNGETSLEITGRGNVDKGEGGNNALAAEQINGYAADLIYGLVNEGRTPLGVVYMNFAGTNTVHFDRDYTVNGVRLPSLIMSNNFKFPLATSSDSSTTNYNASYSNGGNAINNQ